MSQVPLVFLIAGEASGDQLGADLMASLKKNHPVRFAGIGGEAMKEQGLQSLFPMTDLSIIGILGIVRHFSKLWKHLRYTVKTIRLMQPDIVITIDSPEFSFRVMKQLHKLSQRPKLIHYVAPTVWAWRPGRAKRIARFLDHLLCVYPFEPPYFEKYGLPTTFVGHPIAKKHVVANEEERDPHLICVLPGSRRSEIETLMPLFKKTIDLLKRDNPDIKVALPTLPSVESFVRQNVQDWSVPVDIVTGNEKRKTIFQKAFVALAASGTVALQLSAAYLPFVIAYKINTLNAWIGKVLIKTPWACMVNILLTFHKFGFMQKNMQQEMPTPWIPEFLQQECTPERMAAALLILLHDKKARSRQLKAMEETIKLLHAPPGVAAKVVTAFLAK